MNGKSGIHHITAIASNPQECLAFYTQVLGLRLVKKSVNQDQVEAYHLFFGDTTGEPGMDLTFFTFPGLSKGKAGVGAVTTISLAVIDTSLEFWHQRLEKLKIQTKLIHSEFETNKLQFSDPDGLQLEIVGVADAEAKQTFGKVWSSPDISQAQAIGCFYSARLSVSNKALIEPVLTQVLGFQLVQTIDQVSLFQHAAADRASKLEVFENPNQEPVINAAGTVHHIAFWVADEQELLAKRSQVYQLGLRPTEVIDRYYFKSVYFRTPAGILFELATHRPGFTVDEPVESLGDKLALPPFLEGQRIKIEAGLEPL